MQFSIRCDDSECRSCWLYHEQPLELKFRSLISHSANAYPLTAKLPTSCKILKCCKQELGESVCVHDECQKSASNSRFSISSCAFLLLSVLLIEWCKSSEASRWSHSRVDQRPNTAAISTDFWAHKFLAVWNPLNSIVLRNDDLRCYGVYGVPQLISVKMWIDSRPRISQRHRLVIYSRVGTIW